MRTPASMHRCLRALAAPLAGMLLFVLAVPSAGGSPIESQVTRAVAMRGFDAVRANCARATRPTACRAQGRLVTRNGAVKRCTLSLRAAAVIRVRGRSCELNRAAPPWPALGFNGTVGPVDIAETVGAGASTNRLFVSWAELEPAPGRFDFSRVEPTYRALVEAGTPPLVTVGHPPVWAQAPHPPCGSSFCIYPPSRAFDAEWQRFIDRLIAEMPAATGIEIWNEPNWDSMWSPKADPERYAELVSLADAAAARTRQDPPIVFAGLAPGMGGPETIAATEFLRRAYAHGLHYDVLGLHAYPSRLGGESFVPGMLNQQIRPLWQIAAEAGEDPESWITELGVSTGGPSGMSATETEQAEELIALYRAARRTRRIPVVIVHKLRDGEDIDHADWGFHLGIRRADDSPKPAFCALAALRQLPCR
jgi:hypothetical protein